MKNSTEQISAVKTIMDELIHAERGNLTLVKILSYAKKLLETVSYQHVERCVPSEAAGAVAALVYAGCVSPVQPPLIVVSETANVKKNASLLLQVVNKLKALGRLPDIYDVDFERPKEDFICHKRLYNASVNGHDIPPKLWKSGTVDQLEHKFAKKICVSICGKNCSYKDLCHYQRKREDFTTGSLKVQVHSVSKYCNTLRYGKLPKARISVYTPKVRLQIFERSNYALFADDLLDLANTCEKRCTTVKHRKATVAKKAEIIRNCVQKLCNGASKQTARKYIIAIKQAVSDIRSECIVEFRKQKLRKIEGRINAVCDQINRILERNTCFTFCSEKKSEQIQIGTIVNEADYQHATRRNTA